MERGRRGRGKRERKGRERESRKQSYLHIISALEMLRQNHELEPLWIVTFLIELQVAMCGYLWLGPLPPCVPAPSLKECRQLSRSTRTEWESLSRAPLGGLPGAEWSTVEGKIQRGCSPPATASGTWEGREGALYKVTPCSHAWLHWALSLQHWLRPACPEAWSI